MRSVNPDTINLIKSFEGLRFKAYPDPATGGAPWTIGYGHTGNVKPGDLVTLIDAENLLAQDLDRFCAQVEKLVKVSTNDNQFGALVSFAYNCGLVNLANSTLLKLLNQSQYDEAAKQFIRWNKAAGQVMSGLTRRREAETALFRKSKY